MSFDFMLPTGTQQPEGDPFTDILQEWLVGITGFTATLVRPRWQPTPPDQPTLDTDWCAVGIVSDAPEPGFPSIEHIGDGDGSDLLRRHRVLDVLASFYGPHADYYASLAADNAYIGENNWRLEAVGASLISVDDLRVVPDLWQTQWVRRVDVPIRIRRAKQREYPVKNILSAAGSVGSDSGVTSDFSATG